MNGKVDLDTHVLVITLFDQLCIFRSVLSELLQFLGLDFLEIFEVKSLLMEGLLECSRELIKERHDGNDVQGLLDSNN